MLLKVVLFSIFASSLIGQTLLSGPVVHAENFSTLKVVWTTSTATSNTTISFGLDTNYGSTPLTVYHRTSTDAPIMYSHVAWLRGLAPGTTYHYRVLIGGTPVTGDHTFTTATRPNVEIVAPTPPNVTVNRDMPQGLYNLDIEVSTCEALTSTIAGLANLSGSNHQRLLIQSGLECAGTFLWPARPNHTGWVVVMPTDFKVPDGVRFNPTKWTATGAGMYTLRNNYWNIKGWGSINPTLRDAVGNAGNTQSQSCQLNISQGPGSYFYVTGVPTSLIPLLTCSLFYPAYTGNTHITEMTNGTNATTDPVKLRVPGHAVNAGDILVIPSNTYINAGTSGFPSWRYVSEVNGEWITLLNTSRVASPSYVSTVSFTMNQHWKAMSVTYADSPPTEGTSCIEGQKIHVRGTAGELWACTDPTGNDGGLESGGSTQGVWRRFNYLTTGTGMSTTTMQFGTGAKKYRFIGANVTTTPLQNPNPPDLNYYYNPSTRLTMQFMYGTAFSLVDTSDIVLDRVWVNKQGTTTKFDKAVQVVRTSRLGIFDSTLEGMEIRRPSTDPNYTQLDGTEGVNLDSITDGWIDNNAILAGTIMIFSPDSSNGPISQDVKITRNLLQKPQKWFLGTPEGQADGGRYNNRGHFELKQGRRFLLEGNHFDFGISNVNSGSFLMLTNRAPAGAATLKYTITGYTGTTRTLTMSGPTVIHSGDVVWVSGMNGTLNGLYRVETGCEIAVCSSIVLADGPATDSTPGTSARVRIPSSIRTIEDVTTRYNLFTRGTEVTNILGRDTNSTVGNSVVPKVTNRIAFTHNLLIDMNSYTLNEPTTPGYGTPVNLGALTTPAGAKGWWQQGSVEEFWVEHNGTFGLRGGAARGLVNDGVAGKLLFRNNWWFQSNTQALIEGVSGTGTSSLDASYIMGAPAWTAVRNIVCCNFDLSNYPSQWINLAATDDFKLQNPSLTTFDPNSYRFRDSSRFISGSKGSGYCQTHPNDCVNATDDTDVGPDIETLEVKLGKVANARVREVTSTTATISYMAPDSYACTVEYSTSSLWGTGIQVVDGGGDRVRNVSISGLTPVTDYHYRILCAVEQPSGSFRTLE